MFKLLITSALCLPVLFFSAQSYGNNPISSNTLSYAEFQEAKLNNIASCEGGQIAIYFRDTYVRMHSAERLYDGLMAAQDCGYDTIELVKWYPKSATTDDADLAHARATELYEFIDAYDTDMSIRVIDQPLDEIESHYLNGVSAFVRFPNRAQADSNS